MQQLCNKSGTYPFGQSIVWQPKAEWIRESNLQKLMDKHGITDYDRLYQRSINDITWFWEAVLEDLDIQFYKPYQQVVDLGAGIAFPRWCVGGKMNIIHNCLDKWQEPAYRNRLALSWEGEEAYRRSLTYEALFMEVNRCANALRALGIGKGDSVGLFMPMIPELVIAFLATLKVGGIILPLFSGYGASAIAMRLAEVNARVLFTADGCSRRGKPVLMKTVADEALKSVQSVQQVIVAKRLDNVEIPWQEGRDVWWHEIVAQQSETAETEPMDAEDVLMIIYTSGTTGKPKGAVHTHCGFPIKAAMDMYYPMDFKPENTMYWMTDMGWMMGPWLVFGTLLAGGAMMIYDGAPDYPSLRRLWRLLGRHKVSHLGVSPALIRALKAYRAIPGKKYDLSELRMIGSTGSPWDPESWMWLFRQILRDEIPIINYSGGTEISGGILCGNFFKPLKPGAFSGPVIGMDADVVDETGKSVRGAVGELVIRKPWIGMTRGFWKDRQRYLETYWNRFESLWVHGDFSAVDEDELWYILGRSDDTINIAGKRLGPAEVEGIVNRHEAVLESAAIAVPHALKDNEVIVFCVLNEDHEATKILREKLIQLVIKELGRPLKPRDVKFVSMLPKTRNAKIMRRVIRSVYLGESCGDIGSLEDSSAIEAIRNAC